MADIAMLRVKLKTGHERYHTTTTDGFNLPSLEIGQIAQRPARAKARVLVRSMHSQNIHHHFHATTTDDRCDSRMDRLLSAKQPR